jgi:hypothetical protein
LFGSGKALPQSKLPVAGCLSSVAVTARAVARSCLSVVRSVLPAPDGVGQLTYRRVLLTYDHRRLPNRPGNSIYWPELLTFDHRRLPNRILRSLYPR